MDPRSFLARYIRHALFLLIALCLVSSGPYLFASEHTLSIIPAPEKVNFGQGVLNISRGLSIKHTSDKDAVFAASYLNEVLKNTHAVTVNSGASAAPKVIFLHRQPEGNPDESYQLKITSSKIEISASSRAGYLYGVVTLWQILSDHTQTIPVVQINDKPRFKWRGFMLDSARHIQSEEFILKLLDYMALHKLNVLHWHLVDDQGWRIEIKRYPKLTSVGAWRPQTMPPYQSHVQGPYGGYFTQEQIKRIVAYAAERNITVVPEIEMPGHSSAAIAAYPELGSAPEPLHSPPAGWGIFPNLYNVNDSTFTFLQNVLLEVMELFPSQYIHVGGDEAIKDQWKANPAVQARMHELGINSEDQLQSWFTGRIEKFLNAHGRKMVGWDEILEGGLAPNATVMSWRGTKGAIAAARQGHDTVLTPNRPLYFNYRQSDAADEPPGRVPMNTLQDVYQFDTLSSTLTPAEQAHILGVEACIWTEYVITQDRVEHMLFPRLAALSEVAWSDPSNKNFRNFLSRLPDELKRTKELGLHPAESVFEVRVHAEPIINPDQTKITLSTQGSYGEIHYTLDGSNAGPHSSRFNQPIQITFPTTLKAQAFDGAVPLGNPITRRLTLERILRRDSRELDQCTGGGGIQLEQDPPRNRERPVFLVNFQQPCWIYHNVEMQYIHSFNVGVGSIPYIFYGPSEEKHKSQPMGSFAPSLDIHLDSCKGDVISSIPLTQAIRKDGVTELKGEAISAVKGSHDLCFEMKNPDPKTVWLLNYIQPIATK